MFLVQYCILTPLLDACLYPFFCTRSKELIHYLLIVHYTYLYMSNSVEIQGAKFITQFATKPSAH